MSVKLGMITASPKSLLSTDLVCIYFKKRSFSKSDAVLSGTKVHDFPSGAFLTSSKVLIPVDSQFLSGLPFSMSL